MNLQAKLDQFRSDNPYDNDTQAKRLLAGGDQELILHVLALGFATAKQRQRHIERDYIKNVGESPPRERLVPGRAVGTGLVPGRVTGSVTPIKIKPSRIIQNAMRELIGDVWKINGEQRLNDANRNDLAVAIKREEASSTGHKKNAQFYGTLREKLTGIETVGVKWGQTELRAKIESVYGEFRKSEAA